MKSYIIKSLPPLSLFQDPWAYLYATPSKKGESDPSTYVFYQTTNEKIQKMGGNESQSLLYYYISSLKNCVPKTQNREIYNSGECYFTRGWLLTYFLESCTNYPIKHHSSEIKVLCFNGKMKIKEPYALKSMK